MHIGDSKIEFPVFCAIMQKGFLVGKVFQKDWSFTLGMFLGGLVAWVGGGGAS